MSKKILQLDRYNEMSDLYEKAESKQESAHYLAMMKAFQLEVVGGPLYGDIAKLLDDSKVKTSGAKETANIEKFEKFAKLALNEAGGLTETKQALEQLRAEGKATERRSRTDVKNAPPIQSNPSKDFKTFEQIQTEQANPVEIGDGAIQIVMGAHCRAIMGE